MTRYPSYRRLGGRQGRSGQVREEVFRYPFNFSDLSPYYILFVVAWVEEILCKHYFESVGAVSRTVTSSAHHLVTDICREELINLPYQ
jgi:hypothetical protein